MDTCQFQTILYGEPPRRSCPKHGVWTVKLAWAEPGSRFTALFERPAIHWSLAASQKAVAERLRLRWDDVHAIQERAVKRDLARRQADPNCAPGCRRKGLHSGHRYFTIVNDLSRSHVLFVSENRETQSLDKLWRSLIPEQLQSFRAVAMDMWDPYVNSTRKHLPGADSKVVFDKFHIAKHLSGAVGQVRRREHEQLKARGDDLLTSTRYDWLRNPVRMEPEDRKEIAALRNSNLKRHLPGL